MFVKPDGGIPIADIMQVLKKFPFRVKLAGDAQGFELGIGVDPVEQSIPESLIFQIPYFNEFLQNGDGPTSSIRLALKVISLMRLKMS